MKIQRWPLVLILTAWLTGGVGLILGLLLSPHWFSRFGAIVVLLAAAAEYQLLQLEFNTLYMRLKDRDRAITPPSTWQKGKQWAAHVTVASGTFIWGFGDLLLF